MYPNPADPLNGEAAALLMNTPEDYAKRVKEYVVRYATREALEEAEGKAGDESDSEMSEDDDGMDDDDVAAHGLELVRGNHTSFPCVVVSLCCVFSCVFVLRFVCFCAFVAVLGFLLSASPPCIHVYAHIRSVFVVSCCIRLNVAMRVCMWSVCVVPWRSCTHLTMCTCLLFFLSFFQSTVSHSSIIGYDV